MVAWDAARRRVWLLVVTGSGPGSAVSRYGATYRQIAQAARALGASDAVMLDGGGSSTMAVRSGGRAWRVDAPAGTLQRPVPDVVVLVRR
jgi:exopolysaccharide biosynthesis protein